MGAALVCDYLSVSVVKPLTHSYIWDSTVYRTGPRVPLWLHDLSYRSGEPPLILLEVSDVLVPHGDVVPQGGPRRGCHARDPVRCHAHDLLEHCCAEIAPLVCMTLSPLPHILHPKRTQVSRRSSHQGGCRAAPGTLGSVSDTVVASVTAHRPLQGSTAAAGCDERNNFATNVSFPSQQTTPARLVSFGDPSPSRSGLANLCLAESCDVC
jgi:hypothetical protein